MRQPKPKIGEMPKIGSPLLFNCLGCSNQIIEQPKFNKKEEKYSFNAYCDDCQKEDALNSIIVDYAPEEYTIKMALDENVKLGNMTRKWNVQIKDWEYQVTAKGRRNAEEKLGYKSTIHLNDMLPKYPKKAKKT